jgi:hypothetical protein
MNIMTLYFIRDENKTAKKEKKQPIKKNSKTQKRKLKRLRKINQNKMQVDSETNLSAIKK